MALLSDPTSNTLSQGPAQFWDQEWADKWQDMKAFSPVARHTRRLIRNLLGRLAYRSLVDIGCGIGVLLRELNADRDCVDLCGIDFSEVAISLAGRLTPARFHCVDIQRESAPETFDVGVCSEVLEHLEDDVSALRNIRKMCRLLVVTVPSGPLGASSRAIGHVRHYTKDDLERKLTSSGFRLRYLRAWGTPFHDPLYAWIRSRTSQGVTMGTYGLFRRCVSQALYLLFFLNLFDRGHKLVALAERTQDAGPGDLVPTPSNAVSSQNTPTRPHS